MRKLTDRTLYADEAVLSDYRAEDPNPVPLLYQTGYLTLVDYDPKRRRYTLSFPNEEVKYGILESMMPAYSSDAAAGRGANCCLPASFSDILITSQGFSVIVFLIHLIGRLHFLRPFLIIFFLLKHSRIPPSPERPYESRTYLSLECR